MPDSVNHFEMRRLEALSNTIFGVAMTLLAYNLPKGQFLNGPPVWSTIWAAYQSQIVIRTSADWPTSHTQRALYLNLLILLLVILLPVTTGLYGTYGNTRDVVVLYCCLLTVLAGSNGLLWLLAGLERGQPSMAAGMAFTTTIFVLTTLFALIAPQTYIAQWLWNFAFATPFIDGFFERRRRSQTA